MKGVNQGWFLAIEYIATDSGQFSPWRSPRRFDLVRVEEQGIVPDCRSCRLLP